MSKAAAIYFRISQDRDGNMLGVNRQVEDCTAVAGRKGWVVAETYVDDDRSAYSGKPRPGYLRMLHDIKEGHRDGVIAWHLDRLVRQNKELEEFSTFVRPPVSATWRLTRAISTWAPKKAAFMPASLARSRRKSRRQEPQDSAQSPRTRTRAVQRAHFREPLL